MEESTKGGFLAGILVGVAAGLLIAPRRAHKAAGGEPSMEESSNGDPAVDRSELLRRKIEETRRRLRAQVDADSLE